jgi:hypothetical protein
LSHPVRSTVDLTFGDEGLVRELLGQHVEHI